ncbi:glycosyltransferase family 2 protein [Paucihalobacter ruber]|uniref:Glycosyltransferase family 2 protein n=1 Tax=Paucihalobacter ruber TaxID=2567861 RepID=A0A506PIE9_9FLAO|nr:glycosyltransferase family 2 protein [Paucihalobacter ruber]TPV32862.1 glycosyltransferase family 2 protein [Paucihalobacter ruber]
MTKEHPTGLSALIICYNEALHIEATIKQVAFADEIIVVDSFSTDGTFKMLHNFSNVTAIQKTFESFPDQRNFAISQAKYDWVLFLDADERIPQKLQSEIIATVRNPKYDAYKIRRQFYFNNQKIRFSGLQSDATYRLFKKNKAKYDEAILVHEQLRVNGTSGKMINKMLHYSFSNWTHFKQKMEHYATLQAKQLLEQSKKPTVFKVIFKPFYKFIYNYVFRLGFLDGKAGFNICYYNAYGVSHRFKILKELIKNK